MRVDGVTMINLTVLEALGLPALKEAILIAGEKGIGRIITSVNIMEVPDVIEFVNEGELLVTTTYPIKDSIEAQQSLIPNLVKKGVAALAIKPVFYDNVIPASMIQQANDLDFPLIQLPKNASFNKILNPILSEILNRQATILQRNEEVHNNFTNIVLKGGDLIDIANMLSSLQNNPVSIHTNKFRTLSYGYPSGVIANRDLISELCTDAKRFSNIINNKIGQVKFEYKNTEFDVLVHPVIIGGEKYGALILWLVKESNYDINIVEQAVTIAALEIVKHRAVMEVERRFRSFLIEEIIQKKVHSHIDVVTRGEAYGWDLTSKFIPIVIEIEDFLKLYELDKSIYAPANMLRKLWAEVSNAVNFFKLETITVDIGSRILILLKNDKNANSDKLMSKLFNKIQKEISTEKKITINAGIGREVEDIMELSEGFYQAVQALEIGKQLNGTSSITRYDDLGAYRILITGKNNPELRKFSEELLSGLQKNDQVHNTELLSTLDAILSCNFNLKEAAKKLFIHYNTIRYRVNKIEEIAKVDINSTVDRLNLQLASQIKKIQDITKD